MIKVDCTTKVNLTTTVNESYAFHEFLVRKQGNPAQDIVINKIYDDGNDWTDEKAVLELSRFRRIFPHGEMKETAQSMCPTVRDITRMQNEGVTQLKERTDAPDEATPAQHEEIIEAIKALDSEDDSNWTKQGRPVVEKIEANLGGRNITAGQRDEAWAEIESAKVTI